MQAGAHSAAGDDLAAHLRLLHQRLGAKWSAAAAFRRRLGARSRPIILVGTVLAENPYQALIYSAFPEDVRRQRQKWAWALRLFGLSRVYHFHWDEFNLQGQFRGRPRYCALFALFQALGGKLVWTVHNAAPHAGTSPDSLRLFAAGRRFLCARADLIHVHSAAARDHLVAEYGADPARIRVIPHPSYIGWYAAPPDIPPADRTASFLVFGTERAQKGHAFIRDALAASGLGARGHAIRIVGRGNGALWAGSEDAVALDDRFVEDAEVPAIFAGADFCVFGFERMLSSGSVLLALTFGTVPIAPDFAPLRETLPLPLHRFLYRPGDRADLERVLESAASLSPEAIAGLRAAALEEAHRLEPFAVSRQLHQAIHAA